MPNNNDPPIYNDQFQSEYDRSTHWYRPIPCTVDLKRAEAGMKKSGVFWNILVGWANRNAARGQR